MPGWRALLRLYPAEFREEYGADLLATLRESLDQTRGLARLRLTLETAASIVTTAPQEHFHIMTRDLLHSLRRLAAHPGIALVAILSLALGIGASTTMFSIAYYAILRPVPYPDAAQRVVIGNSAVNRSSRAPGLVAAADFMDWRTASQTLDQWHLATHGQPSTAVGAAIPELIRMQSLTPGMLEDHGYRPILGRFIQRGEESQRLAVISEGYWRRRFEGLPTVLGRKLIVGGKVHTIIGVAPAGVELFTAPSLVDFWNAVDLSPGSNWIQRSLPWLVASARLKPGVTLAQARSEMDSLAANLAQAYPDTNRERGVGIIPALEARNGAMSTLLLPLFGAVGFVLLIACSNVASILLARALARRRELSVRAALGASRRRLFREFLMDGLVLTAPGILAGVALAYVGIVAFRTIVPLGFSGAPLVQMNLPVLAFTAVTGTLAGLFASLLPAFQSAKVDLTDAMKDGARGTSSRHHLRSLLVAAEIAMALILLTGAGLMINTLFRLQHQQFGFDPQNVTLAQLHIAGARYMSDLPQREIDMRRVEPPTGQFIENLLQSVRALPGVESAALGSGMPVGPSVGNGARVRVVGSDSNGPSSLNLITSGYFETLRVPLLQGRLLTDHDTAAAPWVALVNEAFVREYFPDGRALGQLVNLSLAPDDRPREIIGVVADVIQFSPRFPTRPEIFTSHFQQPQDIPGNLQGPRFRSSLIVRTASPQGLSAETLSGLVAALDKDLPIFGVTSYAAQMAQRNPDVRFYANFLSGFALIAVLLAAIGLFGLVNHSVTDRIHEIGIRSALGASRNQVIWLVVSYGLKLASAGLVVGLAGSVALTRLLASTLFEIKPWDPTTLTLASLLVLIISALTCAVPAWRATRIHPAIALRVQ